MTSQTYDLKNLSEREVLMILDSLLLVIEIGPASLGVSGASVSEVPALIHRLDHQMHIQRRHGMK